MARVKEQVADIADYVRMQRKRKSAGVKATQGFSQHLVFSGNPGTGKTTVARIIADIYFSLGIVPSNRLVEVDRAGLVGEYVGSTAQKTEKVIQKALGGVLFIDEAYELTPSETHGNDFGKEAVEEILKADGRFARNLYQRCVELQSRRVSKLPSPTPEDLQLITIDDIALATREFDEPAPVASPAIPAAVNVKHIIPKTIRKY